MIPSLSRPITSGGFSIFQNATVWISVLGSLSFVHFISIDLNRFSLFEVSGHGDDIDEALISDIRWTSLSRASGGYETALTADVQGSWPDFILLGVMIPAPLFSCPGDEISFGADPSLSHASYPSRLSPSTRVRSCWCCCWLCPAHHPDAFQKAQNITLGSSRLLLLTFLSFSTYFPPRHWPPCRYSPSAHHLPRTIYPRQRLSN